MDEWMVVWINDYEFNCTTTAPNLKIVLLWNSGRKSRRFLPRVREKLFQIERRDFTVYSFQKILWKNSSSKKENISEIISLNSQKKKSFHSFRVKSSILKGAISKTFAKSRDEIFVYSFQKIHLRKGKYLRDYLLEFAKETKKSFHSFQVKFSILKGAISKIFARLYQNTTPFTPSPFLSLRLFITNAISTRY